MKYQKTILLLLLVVAFFILAKAILIPKQVTIVASSDLSTTEIVSVVELSRFTAGNTVKTRFELPDGFERKVYQKESYQSFLQNTPLKPDGAVVHYFDGSIKPNNNVYCAVVDMDIDAVDLQQCADAVMRFRGEYLYKEKDYSEIKFNFLSDGKPRYFDDYAKGDYSYVQFRKYMKYIFSYANTASLYDELMAVDNKMDIEVGDVLIQKGRPFGHAVTVLDLAINPTTKQKIFILSQSYMPAQETQILLNPNSHKSPWYSTNKIDVGTPEWHFTWRDLRRFK